MTVKQIQSGQTAMYQAQLPNESRDQLSLDLEIKKDEDIERPKIKVTSLHTSFSLTYLNSALLIDLKVVEIDSTKLIGYQVTINTSEHSKSTGKVNEQKIMHDLTKDAKGVKTNVCLNSKGENRNDHTRTLFVH